MGHWSPLIFSPPPNQFSEKLTPHTYLFSSDFLLLLKMLCFREVFDFDDCVKILAMIMQLREYYYKTLLKRDAMRSSPYVSALRFDEEWVKVDELLENGSSRYDLDWYYRQFDNLLCMVELKLDGLPDEEILDPWEAISIERFISIGEPEKSFRELARVSLVKALRN